VPRLIVTAGAVPGLRRCQDFLAALAPRAAARAGQAIEQALAQLETSPEIGRPDPDNPPLRELVIAFGDSGYVALYRYELASDAVVVLAFSDQKEAGYG
jgi:plasmid stabilization system protein ParE